MNQAKRLLVLVVSALLGTAAIVATGTAAWAAPCVTSDPHGTCGPYLYPPITDSNGSNTYVLNNMWAAKPGTTQTLTANDPGNWNVVANAQPPGSTAVQTYPDGQVTLTTANKPDPLSNFGSIISSFSENMHATGSTSAQAAYDIWLGQNASTNYADEVMIWNDQANRGTCGGATVLTNVNFGGSNGVPVQNWTLCRYGPPGPTSELIWYLTNGNEQSGTVDVLSMVNWLVSNGYLPQGTGLNQIDYGFEICSTPGPETFQVSSFSITSTKPGGGQLPQVSTAAATNVTSSGATLNGTVNPESQSTTYHFEYGTTSSYGTLIPVPDGSAGSGSTAVAENANVTGLTASTLYHFRLDATNATGTTHGNDQTFTTTSGGGTAVAYGATGPGSSGAKVSNATSLSWNQAVSGSNTALLVGVSVGQNGDGALSASVTYNGVAMTLLKTVHDNNQPDGFLDVFGLANPASGTHSVAVSVSGGTPAEITGGSESFTGVSQSAPFSIPASAYGSSGTASVAIASHSNDMVAGFMAAGSGITSATSPSARQFIANDDSFTGAGNSAGATSPSTGSNVTMAWSLTSDYWADVAVEVQHA